MNFLGHLYFSGTDKELMLANLFGDFVRGSKHGHFPEVIQKGIKLHRSIDFYIDNHPLVKELKYDLMSELPKVGPVAVDLFFDHLLARNWTDFHQTAYTSFLSDFYQHETDFQSIADTRAGLRVRIACSHRRRTEFCRDHGGGAGMAKYFGDDG